MTDRILADADGILEDITELPMQELLLTEAQDPAAIHAFKRSTVARIGLGHTGARQKTLPYLRFRADHAAAGDAVNLEVDERTLQKLGLFEVQTLCADKYEMLTRPDLGRLFSAETEKTISEKCLHNVDVEVYCGDGLSAPSVGANAGILLDMIRLRLESEGVTVGTPFFVRYCRVNTARRIGPLLGAKVTCVLIGERPGLSNGESTSAYFAYHARPEMSESDYTVVSNISRKGMAPAEAGAAIAELMLKMLKYKVSGLDLKEKL